MDVALQALLIVALAGVDTAAGVRAELATGIAPPGPGDDAAPSVAIEAVPFVALGERAPTWSARLRYFPRLYLREPNVFDQPRVLLFHQLAADHSFRLTRRLEWFALGSAGVGDVDYTETTETIPEIPEPTRLPAVLTMARADASGGLRYAYVRRQVAGVRGFVDHVRPLGAESPAVLPEMSHFGAELTHTSELTPRDDLAARVTVARTLFFVGEVVSADRETPPEDTRWLSVHPELGWQRRFAPRSQFELGAGTLIAREETDRRTIVRPTGRIGVAGPLEHDRQRQLTGSALVSLDSVFDPLRADLRPQAGLEAGLRWWIAPRWRAGVLLSTYTAATSEPLTPDQPESYASLTTPFVRRLSRWAQLELGMRASVRGSHWASEAFRAEDPQLWAYSAITVVGGTEPTDWAW